MINRQLIRIKTVQLVYANIQANTPRVNSDEALWESLEASQKLYNALLGLMVKVTDYRKELIVAAQNKFRPTQEERFPNTRFIDNRLIEAIRSRSEIMDYCEKQELLSDFDTDLYRTILEQIEQMESYKQYMTKKAAPGFDEDKKLWIEILGNIFANCEKLDEVPESRNIWWNDDLSTILNFVIRGVEKIKDDDKLITIPSTFRSKGDEEFARDLYHHAIDEAPEYLKLIDSASTNWDIERMALMEKIIMVCALAEIRNFIDIPTPISINEYIEISKHYSTTKSARFINGILDKIVADWKEKRIIIKK